MRNTQSMVVAAFLAIVLSACSLSTEKSVWIDVRSLNEYREDHIANTEHIPHTEMAAQIAGLNLDKDAPIKLFCRSGVRAGVAKTTLEDLGYTNVKNVGGIADARAVLNR
jgi:phage shock protein E